MVWFAVFFGFFNTGEGILSGTVGFEINDFLKDYLGLIGAGLLMAFLAIVYAVLRLKATPEKLLGFFKKTKDELAEEFQEDLSTQENTVENPTTTSDDDPSHEALNEEEQAEKSAFELNVENLQPTLSVSKKEETQTPELEINVAQDEIEVVSQPEETIAVEVTQPIEEEQVKKNLSDKLVEDFGEFDPRLELGNYKFPPIDLLKDYTGGAGITINQEELEENKNRIVDTLSNYKIGIANIKATVGPTVTLYELSLIHI